MNNSKKIISLLLSLIMVIGIFNIVPICAAETAALSIASKPDTGISTVGIPESYSDINLGETTTVNIEKEGDISFFRFIPERDMIITLTSLASSYAVDTFCYLYDDRMNELAQADGGGSFYNFKITYNVIAGNTYYFGATLGFFSDSGSFEVILTETPVWEHSGGTLTRYNGNDTNVTIPSVLDGETITNIGRSAFGGCTSMSGVIIPDTVSTIGMQAFKGCSALISVQIPDSVTDIDSWAFSGCTSLTEIAIPSSVTKIGLSVFSGCDSLEKIEVSENNPNYVSASGIVYNKKATGIVCVPSGIRSAVLPDTVTEIKMQDFANCESLTAVIIPDSVTRIGMQAFAGCTGLTSVSISNSVRKIDSQAFSDCTSLSDITIPDSVVDIWYDAFNNTAWYDNRPEGVVYAGKVVYGVKGDCPSEVNIKDGTKGISYQAFSRCTDLESITFPDTVEYIGEGAFYGTAWLDAQPEGVIYAGKAACGYKGESPKELIIQEGTLYITDCAYEFADIEKVLLPNSLKKIGTMAFAHCKLTEVVIPEGVERIEQTAFWDNPMTEVTIPASVTYIGEAAFGYYLKSLEKIEGFIIRGYKGTEAERYANDNGFTFIPLDEENGAKVKGAVTSFIDESEVTVKLTGTDNDFTSTVTGTTDYAIEDVPEGEYTLTVSKKDHVTREYTVNVADEEVTQDVKINPVGDVNGDGSVSIADYSRINKHVCKVKSISGYEFKCADVNGDGNVSIADLSRVNKHVCKVKKLW